MNLVERVARRAMQVGAPYRAAATFLASKIAEQGKSAPKKVDDLFKEVKDGNPGYTDDQAWATAWSIYCKHVDPNGEHCHKGPGGYLKEANDAAKVRGLLAKSIKNMKDIRSSHWEGFETKTPELARRTVQMAAEDALQAMEAADKLLAGMPKQAEVTRPTPLAGEQGSIERPTPSASADAPDEQGWNPWEKHNEWNLNIYHPGGRRNLSYFMKNPSGGGGGSNDGTSVSALIKMVIHQTGWAVPHINPHKKDKVWVSILQLEGEDWKPAKQYWEPVPKELLVPKMPRQLTKEEQMDLLTR